VVCVLVTTQNWLPWQRPIATSLKKSKRGLYRENSRKYLSFGEKIVKIGPVDPEIICLKLKKKKLAQAKYIALPASLPSGLNYASILYCFRVIVSYSSKVADFNLFNLRLPPPWGWSRLNFDIWRLKMGFVCAILCLVAKCDGQTHDDGI